MCSRIDMQTHARRM